MGAGKTLVWLRCILVAPYVCRTDLGGQICGASGRNLFNKFQYVTSKEKALDYRALESPCGAVKLAG